MSRRLPCDVWVRRFTIRHEAEQQLKAERREECKNDRPQGPELNCRSSGLLQTEQKVPEVPVLVTHELQPEELSEVPKQSEGKFGWLLLPTILLDFGFLLVQSPVGDADRRRIIFSYSRHVLDL